MINLPGRIPFFQTSIPEDFWLLLVLIPLWWLLSLKLFIFHLLVFFIFLKDINALSKEGRPFKVPTTILPLCFFILTYCFSLILNSPGNSASRTLASLYNLSFWLMGAAVILILCHQRDILMMLRLLSGVRLFGLAVAIFTICGLTLWCLGFHYLQAEGPLALLLNKILSGTGQDFNMLYFTTHLDLIRTDWFAGRFLPRVSSFFLYSTALGAGVTVIIPYTMAYYDYCPSSRLPKPVNMLLLSLPLIFSLSRTAVCALLLAAIHQQLAAHRKKVLIFWLLALFGFFVVLNWQSITSLIIASREGSSQLRILVYQETITESMKNPFIGMGIKPRPVDAWVPIGSHCMYLGILLKTGFLGLFFFLLFQCRVYLVWLSLFKKLPADLLPLWKALGMSFVSISLWMLTDDLDAPHLVALLYFISVGCILRLNEEARTSPDAWGVKIKPEI